MDNGRLIKAPRSHRGGRGFESLFAHYPISESLVNIFSLWDFSFAVAQVTHHAQEKHSQKQNQPERYFQRVIYFQFVISAEYVRASFLTWQDLSSQTFVLLI